MTPYFSSVLSSFKNLKRFFQADVQDFDADNRDVLVSALPDAVQQKGMEVKTSSGG